MNFKDYFGIGKKNIKQNCIICQSFDISLFTDEVHNGFFVKSGDTYNATVIALKNNFLAGDTILNLNNTKCKNIFLFGSCGGYGNAEHGDMLAIDKAYNLESFSEMLSGVKNPQYHQSSKELLSVFRKKPLCRNLIKTNSACVGSIALEAKFFNLFKEKEISAIDMESSIILSAAREIKKNAVCFMYVTDLIKENFSINIGEKALKKRIAFSRKKLADMILRFCNET